MQNSALSGTALKGLRVIDFSRVVAGPYSTMLLGDMGAEVIKIERPGKGDDSRSWGPPFRGEVSTYFLGLNRNKQSVALDLATERGVEIAKRLVADAEERGRAILHEAEDFCDQRLAQMEIVLDRLQKTVQSGRERLRPRIEPETPEGEGEEGDVPFFDQDTS